MSRHTVTAVDLSVVIVNHNHRPVIEKCLASLHALPDRTTFEAVLIDNACSDGTPEWVAARYPEIKVVRNDVRRGFAANANAGIRTLMRGRYALLLNPDVICLPGLLDGLVAFMDGHPDSGVAAPLIWNEDGTLQANCRRFPTPAALASRALRIDTVWESPGVHAPSD